MREEEKFLAGMLARAAELDELIFLHENDDYVMQDNYVEFYIDPIRKYQKSKHIFDEETTVQDMVKKQIAMGDNMADKVSIDNIVKLIKCSKRCIQNNIEKLFTAKDYLISPINMPVKFLHESYYLTAQQEEIKNKIINGIRSGEQKIWGICGTAGTGKTLLLYDIARTLGDEMKVCIIHGDCKLSG